MDHFEEFVTENAPLTITDPNADPYVCGNQSGGFYKCKFKFSEVAEMAKWQFQWPMQFYQDPWRMNCSSFNKEKNCNTQEAQLKMKLILYM